MVAREEDVDVESSYEGYHEFLNLDLFAFRDINVESSYEGYHEFNLNLDPFACRDIGVESSHEGHHEPNPNPDPFTFRDIGVESSYEGYHEFNLNLDPFAFRDINVESSYEGYDEIRPNESASRRIPRSWPHTESQSPPALESLPTSIDSESPMVSEILSSASSWGDCSTGFETDSTWSEDGSVWGEDGTPQIYDHLGLFGITATEKFAPHRKDSDLSVQQLLTPLKKKLVDGIMREFWVIFNQEWTANIQRHSGGSPQSMSSSISQCNNTSGSSSSSRGQKREREDEEDKNPEDNNGRDPKRPKVDFSPLKGSDERMKFACPYRKHDPRKYCHQIRRWRSCALTPLDTIARVKSGSPQFSYHNANKFQGPFVSLPSDLSVPTIPEDLEKHTLAVKACELIHEQQAEGITGNIEKKLRSRKKTYRGQTETERWQEIYRILFPEEGVPSPYYEAVQDDIVQSPDSKELTSYEEYSRRELPRFFQSALEAAIVDEAQPIEERLRSRLVEMIQDCQERVFSTYKARRSTDTPPAAVANVSLGSLESPVSIDQQTEKAREEDITDIIQTLYERVPSQDSHQVHPEMVVADATSKNSGENAVSDSGYVSEPPVSNSDFFTNEDIAASEAVTENSSQHQQPPNTLQSVQETETETEVTVYQTSSLQEATIQQSTTYDTLELRNSESNIDESYPYSTGSEGYDMETGKWMDAWMCLNREETEHVGGF
ncbi:protein phosphatase regulator [Clarireedia jacksonii]